VTWLLAVLLTTVFVELVIRLPFKPDIAALRLNAGKAARVLGSRNISDHWKEKALLVYAGRIFGHSTKAFAWLLLALAPMLLAVVVSPDLAQRILSAEGMVMCTLAAAIYARLRLTLAG
jgi:hypothetical protein